VTDRVDRFRPMGCSRFGVYLILMVVFQRKHVIIDTGGGNSEAEAVRVNERMRAGNPLKRVAPVAKMRKAGYT